MLLLDIFLGSSGPTLHDTNHDQREKYQKKFTTSWLLALASLQNNLKSESDKGKSTIPLFQKFGNLDLNRQIFF